MIKTSDIYIKNQDFLDSFSFDPEKKYYLGQNEFDLAIRNYENLFKISENNNIKKHLTSLNWFQRDNMSLYTDSLDTFARYLQYCILLNVFTSETFNISELENYFTDQLYTFLKLKKQVDKDAFNVLAKYAKNLRKEIEYFYKELKQYKTIQKSFSCFFNSKDNPQDLYRFNIPLVCYNHNQNLIDIYLLLPYYDKIPNWFTIPSIFKIYRYFSNLDIIINNIHYNWYSMNDFNVSSKKYTIPLTENVAKLVAIYGDIMPFPFTNLFNLDFDKRYSITPLSQLTTQYEKIFKV